MPRPRIRILTNAIVLVLLFLAAVSAAAQNAAAPAASGGAAPEPEAAQPAGPVAIAPNAIPSEALATEDLVASLLQGRDPKPTLGEVEEKLAELVPVIAQRTASVREALESDNYALARDEGQQLAGLGRDLRKLADRLQAEARSLAQALDLLGEQEAIWKETRERLAEEQVGATVRKRLQGTLSRIASARDQLRARRREVLGLIEKVTDRLGGLEHESEAVSQALRGGIEQLLSDRLPPLPSADFLEGLRLDLSADGAERMNRRVEVLRAYVEDRATLLGAEVVFLVLLATQFHVLRGRARSRAEENRGLREAERVWEHPWAMALILTALFHHLAHDLSPQILRTVNATLISAAAIWLVRSLSERRRDLLLLAVFATFLIQAAHRIVEPLSSLARLLVLLQTVAGLAMALWVVRSFAAASRAEGESAPPLERRVGLGARIGAFALGLALLAGLAGFGRLAAELSTGIIISGMTAIALYAGAKVVNSVIAYALTARPLRNLNMVRHHGLMVLVRLQRGVAWAFVLWWLSFLLEAFSLRDVAFEGVRGLFTAGLTVGQLTISVGGVLAFVLTFYGSYLLARLLTFVFEEDVFPRVRLARGVPYALSSLSRYAILFLGFLVALAAGGFPLDRVAILVGGLGVGIGFGLQNVVNNFVSGLILLFERPAQVGDSIQLRESALFGVIRRIGIRASVIRTWDGAEVIVPNGVLISDSFTNWTLSDRQRRLEIPFGVAYGTDPKRVIELIRQAASEVDNVVAHPEPAVDFKAFGDSSLDFLLRAWIRDFDVGLSTRSNLVVAINDTLVANGIEIPFPQRDLHLRSVSPEARPASATPDTERES